MADPVKKAREILGLTSDASTADEIHRAYRRKCKRYHPDKNPTVGARAGELMASFSQARQTLLDALLTPPTRTAPAPPPSPRPATSSSAPSSSSTSSKSYYSYHRTMYKNRGPAFNLPNGSPCSVSGCPERAYYDVLSFTCARHRQGNSGSDLRRCRYCSGLALDGLAVCHHHKFNPPKPTGPINHPRCQHVDVFGHRCADNSRHRFGQFCTTHLYTPK